MSLATAAVGAREAGRFFLLWTAAWLLATILKFGLDGILPRVVAEARLARRSVPSLRVPALAGGAVFAIALVPLLVAFRVPIDVVPVASTIAIAFCWSAVFVLAGALKAHGNVALSGVVMNTLWPLGPTLAPLVVAGGGGWKDLAEVTAAAGGVSLVVSMFVTARALGAGSIAALVRPGLPRIGLEADVVGAAVLSVLYELIVWLPVVVVALTGLTGTVAAAVFTAVRVSGLVSWPYNAIVATLTPRIAGALAQDDVCATRRLLTRGSTLGVAVTMPLALAVALAARPVLHVFNHSYGVAAVALAVLVAGRIFDAAAGPVGEALLVGRGTWLDSALASVGIAVGLVLGVALKPVTGATAAGIAGGTAFALTNVLRVGAVWRLLSRGWRAGLGLSGHGWRVAAWTSLAAGIAAAVTIYLVAPRPRYAVAFAIAASLLACAGAIGAAAVRRGARAAIASPIGVLALVLAGHFALRPLSLILDPGSAATVIATIGFDWRDVALATALGAAGLGVFAAAFVLAWGRDRAARVIPNHNPRRLLAAIAAALAVGTVLWAVLFRHLGGTSALADDPAAVHLNQYGAGYGTFGLCLCFGATLVALQGWLADRRRRTFLLALVASVVAIGGSLALASRGIAVATALAAAVLILRHAAPRPRTIVVLLACAVVFGVGAAVVGTIRDYAQYEPTSAAVRSLGHTRPFRFVAPNLIEFDHLVALERVVPNDLGWLNGSSLVDIPGFFVPRQLWPQKPRPLDFRLSEELNGAHVKAGTPFTLPGEAWWNLRFGGALAFLLVLGTAAGLGWRLLLERGGPAGELAAAMITGHAYLLYTRPLGPMLLTAATAAVATVIVYFAATLRAGPATLRTASAGST